MTFVVQKIDIKTDKSERKKERKEERQKETRKERKEGRNVERKKTKQNKHCRLAFWFCDIMSFAFRTWDQVGMCEGLQQINKEHFPWPIFQTVWSHNSSEAFLSELFFDRKTWHVVGMTLPAKRHVVRGTVGPLITYLFGPLMYLDLSSFIYDSTS